MHPVPNESGPAWTVDGYDDLREIGRGGTATVYSARQIALDRRVALKVLHLGLTDPGARRRFERECAVLGALGDAPGIVPVHAAAFTSDGRGCIVMKLMAESLADVLRREGPLDPTRVRDIGVAASVGLGHAHRRGIVHRDVKPGNLLVASDGTVAIGDFDIASAGSFPSSTTTNDSLSPPHAPPERLTGEVTGSPSGDVWSLGSALFTLLDDRQPFGNASTEGGMAGLIRRVLDDPLPRPARGDVPPALFAVLERAMAKDPADRWPDMAAMADALAAVELDAAPAPWAEEPATRLDAGAQPAPSSAQTRSRPGATVTLAVVLVAVLTAVVLALVIAFG